MESVRVTHLECTLFFSHPYLINSSFPKTLESTHPPTAECQRIAGLVCAFARFVCALRSSPSSSLNEAFWAWLWFEKYCLRHHSRSAQEFPWVWIPELKRQQWQKAKSCKWLGCLGARRYRCNRCRVVRDVRTVVAASQCSAKGVSYGHRRRVWVLKGKDALQSSCDRVSIERMRRGWWTKRPCSVNEHRLNWVWSEFSGGSVHNGWRVKTVDSRLRQPWTQKFCFFRLSCW